MAAIVGARHTDDDLLPVFHAYRFRLFLTLNYSYRFRCVDVYPFIELHLQHASFDLLIGLWFFFALRVMTSVALIILFQGGRVRSACGAAEASFRILSGENLLNRSSISLSIRS